MQDRRPAPDSERNRSIRGLVLLGLSPLVVVLGLLIAIQMEGMRQSVVFVAAWAAFATLMTLVARATPPASRNAPKTSRGLATAFREYIRFHSAASKFRQRRTELVVLASWLFPIVLYLLLWINAAAGIVGTGVSR